jgi:hypothetical protein
MRPGSGWTIAVLTTLAAGCREPTAAPRAPVPPHQATPMVPVFNLVQDSTVVAESLLREVVVQLPESGSADSDLVVSLWSPGELTGPVLIEVAGGFQLDAGSVAVTDALTSGALLWYEQTIVTAPPMRPPSGASPSRAGPLPGDVVVITLVRPVQLSFEALAPGDTAVRLGVDLAGPRDSARFVDTAAASHGVQLRWSYSDGNTSLGFPENLDSSCAVVGPFGCAPLPPRDSAHLSNAQPHGEVRVRIYRGGLAASVAVDTAYGQNPTTPYGSTGSFTSLPDENEVLLRATTTPSTLASLVRWSVVPASDAAVETQAPSTPPSGAMSQFLVSGPANAPTRWSLYPFSSTLTSKRLGMRSLRR